MKKRAIEQRLENDKRARELREKFHFPPKARLWVRLIITMAAMGFFVPLTRGLVAYYLLAGQIRWAYDTVNFYELPPELIGAAALTFMLVVFAVLCGTFWNRYVRQPGRMWRWMPVFAVVILDVQWAFFGPDFGAPGPTLTLNIVVLMLYVGILAFLTFYQPNPVPQKKLVQANS